MPAQDPLTPFDFATDDPQRLLAEHEPEDLYRAVKALTSWNARALEVSESALAYWTSSAVGRTRDREAIGEVRSLIRRLQAIQPLARQEAGLDVAARYQRWNGMVAVLESRAHLMDYHDPDEVGQRAHMSELRAALAANAGGDALRTQELLATLGVSAPRLSQLLALAEAAGLIERQKRGREQWVSAAGSWRRNAGPGTRGVGPTTMAVAAQRGSVMHAPGRAKLVAA